MLSGCHGVASNIDIQLTFTVLKVISPVNNGQFLAGSLI